MVTHHAETKTLRLACTYPTRGRTLPRLLPTPLPERNSREREERDPRRFNSLEEAEQFAEGVRRANRIFTELDKGV